MLRNGEISGRAFLKLLFGTSQNLPPEDQNYEFKSLDLLQKAAKKEKGASNKLFRTVSAFAANERGSSSFLILGIREGKPEQRALTEEEKDFLKHAFIEYPENYLNPPATVEYTIQPLDFKTPENGELVVIHVLGEGTPHKCLFNRNCYIREGAHTRAMTDTEIRLLKERAEPAKEKPLKDFKERTPSMTRRAASLRGRVIDEWKKSGQPTWDIEETIRVCKRIDEQFLREEVNPAPKFREARLKENRVYMRIWVSGCRFPWLNPR